jgi:hypothetical protein
VRAAFAATVLLATACQQGDAQGASLLKQRQAKLDQIADLCRLSRSTFKLVGPEELQLEPSPDAKYESLDCALAEIRKTNIPFKMGFVGNEYYPGNEQR